MEKTMFFYETQTGTLLGRWVMPRHQTVTENRTIHNFNVIPTRNGRHVLAGGHYQAGTWVVDFTNPAKPRAIAWSDPPPIDENVLVDGGAWPPATPCQGREATIVGTRGDDVLVGTSGNDVIHGRGGKDVILGKGGTDRICGGAGNDRLVGGPGNDRLKGGAGNDLLEGRPGDDTLHGGPGHDRCRGGRGNDRAIQCERVSGARTL